MSLTKLEEPYSQYIGEKVDFSPVPDGKHSNDWTRGTIIGVEETTNYLIIQRAEDHSLTTVPPFVKNFVFFA